VREVIVNVHHFAGMIAEYLRGKNSFGMRIGDIRRGQLADTGGGLKRRLGSFAKKARGAPFILHNVDVIAPSICGGCSTSTRRPGTATLAVQRRQTSRYLLFDEQMPPLRRRLVEERKTELVGRSPQFESWRSLEFT